MHQANGTFYGAQAKYFRQTKNQPEGWILFDWWNESNSNFILNTKIIFFIENQIHIWDNKNDIKSSKPLINRTYFFMDKVPCFLYTLETCIRTEENVDIHVVRQWQT